MAVDDEAIETYPPRLWTLSEVCRGFVILAATTMLTSSSQAGERKSSSPPSKKATDGVGEVLKWLPTDTETIVVTNGPLEKKVEPSERDASQSQGVFSQALSSQAIWGNTLLTVHGARRFRAPRGFGAMRFEGCTVGIVKADAVTMLTAEMQALMRKSSETTYLAGKKVAVFTKKAEGDTSTFFLAQPKPNVFLCATHEGYLNTVLTQMGRGPATRAMPSDLPEWAYVRMDAPVWSIRHYSKANPAEDPSSPFQTGSPPSRDVSVPDPYAIGLVFFGDLSRKHGTVFYLSAAKDALAIVRKRWSVDMLESKLEIVEVKPGVIRTTIIGDRDDGVWTTFMFLLMFQLGHGVSV